MTPINNYMGDSNWYRNALMTTSTYVCLQHAPSTRLQAATGNYRYNTISLASENINILPAFDQGATQT